MIIFLIGLPGSGKSTLGHRIAKVLNYQIEDLDAIIEKKQGRTIADIFKEKGEEEFRIIESAALKSCKEFKNTVIATGGGTPCFFDNIEVMNNSGLTIFIDVPPGKISSRLTTEEINKRPLFKGLSADKITDYLNKLLEARLPYYTKAKLKIDGSDSSIEKVKTAVKS